MRHGFFLLATWAFLLAPCTASVVHGEQVLVSKSVDRPPVIDGQGTDKVWEAAKVLTTFDSRAKISLEIKSVHTATDVFFLVSFPDRDESRRHRSWVWNKDLEMYDEGPDREDVLVFKWKLNQSTADLSLASDQSYEADIWYWKAARTDPQGFADDKIQRLSSYQTRDSHSLTSKTGTPMYLKREGDVGGSAYKTNIYVDYRGDVVERYSHRPPTGSRGDVRAKGEWREGRWTIEFARALVTGHGDDVNFDDLGQLYGFGISRYEIAGRPINPECDQPLFGSGDISEPLLLSFD